MHITNLYITNSVCGYVYKSQQNKSSNAEQIMRPEVFALLYREEKKNKPQGIKYYYLRNNQ